MSKPRMKPADVDALDEILNRTAVPPAPARHITAQQYAAKYGVSVNCAHRRLINNPLLESAICIVPGSYKARRCWWPK